MQLPALSPASLHVKPATTLGRLVKMARDVSIRKIPQTLNYPPKLRQAFSQGYVNGSCVGLSWTQWLNTSSVFWYNKAYQDALDLWNWCKVHEKQPASANVGVSPDDAMLKLRNDGLLAIPLPVYDIDLEVELRRQILNVGPVVFSLPWYSSFDTPVDGAGSRGRLQLNGDVRGGHAILCYWYDTTTNCYWWQQSWTGYPPYDKYNQIVEVPRAIVKKLMNRGAWAMGPTKVAGK